MITRKVNLTIKNNKSKPDSKIYLYRKDRGVILNITLIDNPYTLDSTFAGAVIVPPTGEPVTIPKEHVQDNLISLHIEASILDQLEEVGEHLCHIHLFDLENNRVTVPAFTIYVEDTVGDMDEEYEREDLTEGRIALATSITNLGEPTAHTDALEKMASNIDKAKEDIDILHELDLETMEDEYLTQMGAMEEEHLLIIEDINNQHLVEMGEIQTELDLEVSNTRTGKEFLATSITSKGVETAPTDSFETMAGNIDSIEVQEPKVGIDVSRLYMTFDADTSIANNAFNTYTFLMHYKEDGLIKSYEISSSVKMTKNKYPNGDNMYSDGYVLSDGTLYGMGYNTPTLVFSGSSYIDAEPNSNNTRGGAFFSLPSKVEVVKIEAKFRYSNYNTNFNFAIKCSVENPLAYPDYDNATELFSVRVVEDMYEGTSSAKYYTHTWIAPNYVEENVPVTLEYEEDDIIQEQINTFKNIAYNANRHIENLQALR